MQSLLALGIPPVMIGVIMVVGLVLRLIKLMITVVVMVSLVWLAIITGVIAHVPPFF